MIKGSEYKIEVTCGRSIIKNIYTAVKNNVLIIENRNKCNFVRGFKKKILITITVPYVQKVTNNSVAPLTFDENFSQDSIYVDTESSGDSYIKGSFKYIKAISNGNGDIYLAGSTGTLDLYSRGTNYVHAESLSISDYAAVESSTFGDCFINGTGLPKMDYRITRSGNIYYTGTIPLLWGIRDKDAQGELIKQD